MKRHMRMISVCQSSKVWPRLARDAKGELWSYWMRSSNSRMRGRQREAVSPCGKPLHAPARHQPLIQS